MNGTIDDRYFEWLYGQVGAVRNRNPARSYWKLLVALYTTEFQWFVSNDDNRIEDGKDLRFEFIDEYGDEGVHQDWLELGCSMLEMMLALARRMSYEAEGTSVDWFWKMVKNLELDTYTDAVYEIAISEEVEEVLERVNKRTYARSGAGGLFPLRYSTHDQRTVELWYQMSAYLLESNRVEAGPK